MKMKKSVFTHLIIKNLVDVDKKNGKLELSN